MSVVATPPRRPPRVSGPTIPDLVVEHVWEVLRGPWFRFLAATAVALVVLFARAPGAWVTPLFFAEDRDWTSLIVTRGFWHTVLHARPDYCVFGNVLVLWTGMRLCDLFAGGDPLALARWQAVASYLAFAIVVSLPVLLLRRRLPPAAIPAVWLLALFMPLGIHSGSWSGYEILGRSLNVGFAALFVGFLLVWVRVTPTEPRPPWKILLLDLGLLACIATNPICTVLVPAAALPLLRHLLDARCRAPGSRDALRHTAGSLASLAAITLATLALNGIPAAGRGPAAGLSGAPFDGDRIVEFALARSLLYTVTWPIYAWLDTPRTLLVTASVGLLLWRVGLPRHRFLQVGGCALLAVTSATLVCCRSDVGRCLDHYRTTFPDRYFYAQYLVGLPLLAAFVSDLSARLAARPWLARLPWLALYSLAGLAAWSEPVWRVADSQFIVDDDGCFARAAVHAVDGGDFRDAAGRRDPDGPFVAIPVHPAFQDVEILLPRLPVERSVGHRRGDAHPARMAGRPAAPRH